MKFKQLANPLLIIGDNPALPGGLSRSGRDIATLAATLPAFRVAYLGRGLGQRRKLPFPVYDFDESGNWGEKYLPIAWNDFSEGQDGIILSTDDPSRRHWIVRPDMLAELPAVREFLGEGRNFLRWGYFPIDSVGPAGNRLPWAAADCILRYDRVLAASEWGRDVCLHSGRVDADWLPHGIHPDVFRLHTGAKGMVGWKDSDVWVGCVMSNQSRKDFPALFECFMMLKQHYGNRFHGWLHTDSFIRYWNVYALQEDYMLGGSLEVTTTADDGELAVRYSACDCTVLPSAGEGFGFPIAESLACGTPCVVTDYAAGQEVVEADCRVKPAAFRIDTTHNVMRAVLSGVSFAEACKVQIEKKRGDWEYRSEELAQSVGHLLWPNLKHLWVKWLLAGLGQL